MNFWKTFFACLLAIFISSIISLIFSIIVFVGIITAVTVNVTQMVEVQANSILTIDMSEPIVENLNSDLSSYLSYTDLSLDIPMTISSITEAIQRAAIDPKIKGISLRIPLVDKVPSSIIYELREALSDFKKQAPDKFIYSYGDGYSQLSLYLSSVADKVFMSPAGMVMWIGQSATPLFFKGTLDNLGIEPQIIRNGQFKGAVEPLILTELSKENREQMLSLLNSNWNYLVQEVADARGIDYNDLQRFANQLVIQDAQDAVECGLIDKLLYSDELDQWLSERVGVPKVNTITTAGYLSNPDSFVLTYSANTIKVIYAIGDIVDSQGDGQIVGSTLAEQISEARSNQSVKAIVLRVNSPGGSAVASEVIWREVCLAAEEKPLVISMGEYAASGGYWIAAPATKIFSTPFTTTGSIGVFGVMFDLSKGAKDILGITTDVVKTNPYADMGSPFRKLSPLERSVIQNGVNSVYDKFLGVVSKGRTMELNRVDSIGAGRIWSGIQAKELGLVDEIGSLSDAIEQAAKLADVSGDYIIDHSGDSEMSLLNMIFGGVKSVISTVSNKIFGSSPQEIVLERLTKEHGTIQARMPYLLEIN